MRLLTTLACAMALMASAAWAQPAASAVRAELPLASCETGYDQDQEQADQRLLDTAWSGFTSAGFPALRVYIPRLEEAMARAPACYPKLERRGAGIVVRSADPSEYPILQTALTEDAGRRGERVALTQAINTYVEMAFTLGSYAVEMRRYDEAIRWLDRGLALQPNEPRLLFERSAALSGAGRYPEAYEMLERVRDDPLGSLVTDKARLQRLLGVTLIDLGRLDEAEAALNESIRLEPNNPAARGELEYIARLRAGAAPQAPTITAPNAPKSETL